MSAAVNPEEFNGNLPAPSPVSTSVGPRSPRSSSTQMAPSSVALPTPPPWVTRAAPLRPSPHAWTRPSVAPPSEGTPHGGRRRRPWARGSKRGHVTLAVNLGWHDFALRDGLEATLGLPVVIENDVRAAVGLYDRNVVDGAPNDLAYLAVGTGIAAGVVLDGKLHRGARGRPVDRSRDRRAPAGRAAVRSARLPRGLRSGALHRPSRQPADGEGGLSGRGGRRSGRQRTRRRRRATTRLGGPHARHDLRRPARRGRWRRVPCRFAVRGPAAPGTGTAPGASDLAGELLPADIVDVLPPEAEAGAWGAVAVARTAGLGPAARVGGGEPRLMPTSRSHDHIGISRSRRGST